MGLLGGAMAVTGYYETVDPAHPTFDVDVRVAQLDIPSAFAGLGTVRAFAPVAGYARGRVSADLRLNGTLTPEMHIVQEVLSAVGSFRTADVLLEGFPPLDRLAEALELPRLRDPGFLDVHSTLVIRDGRLHVNPFDVPIGGLTLNVAGSNGLDRSLRYTLGLEVPRSALGAGADRAVASLVSQAAGAGVEIHPADVISMAVQLGGTITNPSITTDFRGVTRSAAQGVEQTLRQEADRRAAELERQREEAAEEARQRAAAEAARLMADAQRRATIIRDEARALAERVRDEGYRQADALLERATTPAARLAARPAADRLRREADDRAARIIREADARADALLDQATTLASPSGDG